MITKFTFFMMYNISSQGLIRNKAMTINRILGFSIPGVFRKKNELKESKGFVPCPMFQNLSSKQQSLALEIYRLAEQLTREQLQSRRKSMAEFSPN
jgi:hypothetical protein